MLVGHVTLHSTPIEREQQRPTGWLVNTHTGLLVCKRSCGVRRSPYDQDCLAVPAAPHASMLLHTDQPVGWQGWHQAGACCTSLAAAPAHPTSLDHDVCWLACPASCCCIVLQEWQRSLAFSPARCTTTTCTRPSSATWPYAGTMSNCRSSWHRWMQSGATWICASEFKYRIPAAS